MNIRTPRLQRRPATIRDVARELNVSVATVSRAISKPHLLKASTAERVRAAVERLGYAPNLVAQNLQQGYTGIIYVINPSLSPFFLEVFSGIERAALEFGYSAIMAHTARDQQREGNYFDQVACGRADGVLLVSTARSAAIPRKYRLPPTVAILDQGEEDFPAVRIDHVMAGMQATEHLLRLGHRHIAHIEGTAHAPMALRRREGFVTAMRAAGCAAPEELCVPGGFTVEAGEAGVNLLLQWPKLPTAIFAANDELAIGALRTIRSAGLGVPGDISVVGCGDQRFSQYLDPPLTTIHIPKFDLGYQAMVKMHRVLMREEHEHDAVLPIHLIERGTTAPPRSAARRARSKPARALQLQT